MYNQDERKCEIEIMDVTNEAHIVRLACACEWAVLDSHREWAILAVFKEEIIG